VLIYSTILEHFTSILAGLLFNLIIVEITSGKTSLYISFINYTVSKSSSLSPPYFLISTISAFYSSSNALSKALGIPIGKSLT
jgi:hypothetical protein